MKDELDDTNPFKQINFNDPKNNDNDKNNLLNEFMNENKNKCKIIKNLNWKKNKLCILISIIISIIIIAILIIIISLIPKNNIINKIFKKKNNTLKLIYYTSEEQTDFTLFSSSILSNILSLEIDGKIIEEINNYYYHFLIYSIIIHI